MQEIRWDGTDCLTEKATKEQFIDALDDKRNKTVIAHKTGSIITRTDGSQYQVWSDGSLRKIKDRD